ncbi:restriction endonuclease subunit S [Levilactobacillus zymae]|uniref:restriction endonuclease subunit S n=1 Tax=Levilactobacillus zymae TaxID=267363 RepID=UPI003FCC5393
MNDNQAKYPQLRFKGFTDPWEQRKLNDAVDNIGTGKSKYMLQEKSDLAKYEVLGSTSVIGYDEDYDHEGDFILTARVGANAGNLYHHSGKVKITDNTVFIQGENLAFVYNLLTQFDLKKLSFGTGQPLVKSSELKNLILYFPNNDEQAKIGSFFKQLDDTITLHQRKLAKLKELKQGYLQKLFPRNGSKFPQLRFAGFADDWEERKLGELGKIYTGNTPKTSDLDNWTDNKEGHIWITPTDIDKLIMSDSDRHLSEQGWSKARKIPENSVLITSIASIGKNTINAVPVAFNQQINAIVPEKNDSYFILSAMIKDTARFASVAGQTATAIINKTTFEKFQIATPSYEEQQKIGSFFKQLDDTITLHQRKLDLLKEQKKGFLQKMFV